MLDTSNERLLTTFLLFSSKESSPNFTYFVINSPSGFTTTKQDVRTSYIRRFSNSADTTMLCPATQGLQQWPVSVASGWPTGWLDVAADQRLGRAAEALFRDWLCIYCLLLHEDFVLSPCARKIMTFNRLFSNKLCCKTSTLLEFQIVEAHHYHRHIGCCCRHNLKFLGLIEFDLSFFLLNFLIYCSPSQIFRLSTDIRCAN